MAAVHTVLERLRERIGGHGNQTRRTWAETRSCKETELRGRRWSSSYLLLLVMCLLLDLLVAMHLLFGIFFNVLCLEFGWDGCGTQ